MTTKTKKKPVKKAPTKKPEKEATNKTPGRGEQKDFLARQRRELEAAKRAGGGEFWRPSEGRSVMRMFTFENKGEPELFVKDTRHWSIDGTDKSNMGCCGDDCPICDLKGEIGDKAYEKVRAQSKFLVNAVVRKADGTNDKQVIASLPGTVYKDLLAYVTGEDDDVQDCLDPNIGCDFKIARVGKGLDTKYTVIPMPNPGPIGMEVKPANLFDKVKKAPTEEEAQLIADAIRDRK